MASDPDVNQIVQRVHELPDRVLAVATMALVEECLDRITEPGSISRANSLLAISTILALKDLEGQ